jgi:hypothetical protein
LPTRRHGPPAGNWHRPSPASANGAGWWPRQLELATAAPARLIPAEALGSMA